MLACGSRMLAVTSQMLEVTLNHMCGETTRPGPAYRAQFPNRSHPLGGQVLQLPLVLFTLLFPLMSARGPAGSTAPKNGEELIAMMHDRYAGKWYRTLTFTQKTTLPDGKVETWYEAL